MTKGRESDLVGPSWVEVKRLGETAKPEVPLLVTAVASLAISSSVTLYFPKAFGDIVDLATASASLELRSAALGLMGLFVLSAGATFVRTTLLATAGERIGRRLRTGLFSSLLFQEAAFFDQHRTGELVSRLSTDCTMVSKCLTEHVSGACRGTVEVIGGSCLLIFLSPKLAVATLLVVPFVSVGAAVYGRYIKYMASRVADALAEATTHAQEALSHHRTVTLLRGQPYELQRYTSMVETVRSLATRVGVAGGAFHGMAQLAGNASMLAVVFYGASLVASHDLTTGQLTSFLMYSIFVAGGLVNLSGLYGELMRGIGASQRVFELQERVPSVADPPSSSVECPHTMQGALTLDRVTFAYPTRPTATVLNELSLSVKPGEVIAVVGESGEGKSTLGHLICRLYDVDSGRVLIDGHNVSDVPLEWVRGGVGVVSQEPALFATTIEENISYGRPDATREEVQVAAQLANASEFISRLPKGLDTYVGERGTALSAGQKQRLAIARTVLHNPSIIVLDEATSALDPVAEQLITQALDKVSVGRTTIIIAHRLATIRRSPRIVVISGGRVVQDGSWEELLADPQGRFAKLVNANKAHTAI